MEFLRHTLSNGLEIIAECNAAAHSTALGFIVNAGARDENDAIAGVSHFLEHMAFKGTPSRSAEDVNREFDEMGAHYNASTSEENTVYYATVLPEHQNAAEGLLADILRPSLRDDDFNTEKLVILQEIPMCEDEPPFRADEKARSLYFGSHPLGRSILGSVESVGALTPQAMGEYFRERYSPGNILLAAAGRVDFDALVSCAERCCGHWTPVATSRKIDPAVAHEGFQVLQKETATQQYLIQLAAGPAAEDSDRYAAKLLATVLGDDSGSRLYWELVDPGLVEGISLSHCEHQGAGMMMTYMSCDPEQTADNLRRILKIYREADSLTPAEIDQAKSKIRSRIVLSSERPRGRLFAVATDWIYRREYSSVESDLNAIAALTLDDLLAVLAKYPLANPTTVTIGPLAELVR
jgi:predicted Zn-dependent peptidase